MVPFHIITRSSPSVAMFLCWPERKPSPRPTRTSSDPTPHAMPNMVRKLRSLLATMARKTWLSVSVKFCMAEGRCSAASLCQYVKKDWIVPLRLVLTDLDRGVGFDVFLAFAAEVGDGASGKVYVIANNTCPPAGFKKLRKRTLSGLIGF